ncbi:MAG: AbrB/MazE/SpoVT family DNA-binding domain-containing protein [Candidatus Woesearchaeota archaeon]
MQRKLVKQGQNALTVTIPARWTQANNLKAGDIVEIGEEGNNIIISSENKEKLSKQQIMIDKHTHFFVERIITNAYKKGIDELKLIFNKQIPTESINHILSNYAIGYEVTDITKDYCVIRSFSSESEENIDITIRKCFFMIKEMYRIILEDINKNKFNSYDELVSLNNNVRKLANYAIRITIKTVKDSNIIQYNTNIFTKLYLFTLRTRTMYKNLSKEKKINHQTVGLIHELSDMFNIFYDAYYKKDIGLVKKLLSYRESMGTKIDKVIDCGNGKVILQLFVAMRCIHDSIGHLTGLIIH